MFYIVGGILAVSAVVVSFIGLKAEKFPGKMGPVVVLVFLALIGTAVTYSVLNGQEESEHRAHELELANAEIEHEEEDPVPAEEPAGGHEEPAGGEKPAAGAKTTIALAASATELAYDKKSLTAKAGEVTIALTNPAPLEHDVAIFEGSEELGGTELISNGENSTTTVELAAGKYTFLCTVPGHAEAGMEGPLTVK